jgi:hypothetical protein
MLWCPQIQYDDYSQLDWEGAVNQVVRYCVSLLFIFIAISNAQTKVTPAGRWEGSITTPTGALKVIVDLDRDDKGIWIGDIDIPDQGVKDLPLRDVSVSGDAVSFGLPAGPGEPMFKGKVSPDGSTISGDFSQSGSNVPFSLKRTGEAKVNLPGKNPELPEKFTGKWEGKLDTPGGSLSLVFNLSNKDGSAIGTIDSPDQGAVGIPISLISASDSSIKIGVQLVSGEYKGKLGEDGKTLTGDWSQGGQTLPLVLKKK